MGLKAENEAIEQMIKALETEIEDLKTKQCDLNFQDFITINGIDFSFYQEAGWGRLAYTQGDKQIADFYSDDNIGISEDETVSSVTMIAALAWAAKLWTEKQ